jgi:shikimate kinase
VLLKSVILPSSVIAPVLTDCHHIKFYASDRSIVLLTMVGRSFLSLLLSWVLLGCCHYRGHAFTVGSSRFATTTRIAAGGFEWEDPAEAFDQGVENPFKNPALTKGGDVEEEDMKIDPARLLGPRLGGSNLYLIGIMGSGKSAVGDKVARRKC